MHLRIDCEAKAISFKGKSFINFRNASSNRTHDFPKLSSV